MGTASNPHLPLVANTGYFVIRSTTLLDHLIGALIQRQGTVFLMAELHLLAAFDELTIWAEERGDGSIGSN